jgi:Serine carboxypeptidase
LCHRDNNQKHNNNNANNNVLFANGVNDYKCGGETALDLYLAHPAVRTAMHIPDGTAWFDGDDGDGIDYTNSTATLADIYWDLAKGKYADAGVRVLVYDGDTDPSISSLVAQDFIRNLGLKEVESWRPWTLDSCRRIGGSVTRYEGSIEFLTIRGSG